MTEKQYLQILIEDLRKKLMILEQIEQANKEQSALLRQDETDINIWETLVDKKAEYIQEIIKLDEGFSTIYNRLREILQTDKELYAAQIQELQKLIGLITAKSVDIQAQELRNKDMAQNVFCKLKKGTRTLKEKNKVANLYEANMKKLNVIDAQFLDKRN